MNKESVSPDARETWKSKSGFIAACMGAAIGLGNIWLFPWRLSQFGGAAFLVPYLLFVFGLVRFGLAAELALGRQQQRGPIGAFKQIFRDRHPMLGAALGAIPVIGVSSILVFYTIVLGWILKYFVHFVMFGFSATDPGAMFGEFSGNIVSVPWHLAAMGITMAIVAQGVQGGLERINKIAMPALFVILIVLLIRTLTLPGAMEGAAFLLRPEWSFLADPQTWIMALGQSFFTVSLGGMIIYGSYLSRDIDIPHAATTTSIMNSTASILAAFVLIPAVFAFGLDHSAGPDLLFVTAPKIFNSMPGGRIFGSLFFLSVVLAGISSAMNLIEAPVEAIMDVTGMSRKKAVIVAGVGASVVGIFLDLNMTLFTAWVNMATIYLLPLGAVLIAIVMLWVLGPKMALEAVNLGCKKPWGAFRIMYLKWVFAPVCLLVLILGMILGGIG